MDKLIKWIIYYLVPFNATEQETNDRIFEVGLSIGFAIGMVVFLIFAFNNR